MRTTMIDPVCGMEISAETAKDRSTFGGKTYGFCSRDCREEFDEDPEGYIGDEDVFGQQVAD